MDKIEIKRNILENIKTTIESASQKKIIYMEQVKYSDGSLSYEIKKEIINKDDPINNKIH